MSDADPSASLSVVIPARNAAGHLQRCLEAIRSARFGERAEIVIVDDHSPAPLEAQCPVSDVRWIRLERRRGPASARNAGAKQAAGELLVFFDADVVVEPNTLQALVEPLLSGRADVTHGVYRDTGDGNDAFARYKADWAGYKDHHRQHSSMTYLESFAFACRREFFLASGGFSESLGPREVVEDVEWSNRLRAHDARIVRVAEARVQHLHGYTLRSFFFWQVFNASSVLRLRLALRGQPWTPSVGGIPRGKTLALALSSVASVLLLGFAAAAVLAIGSGLSWLLLAGLLLCLLLFLLTQADFLLFVLRRRSCGAALRDLLVGFITGIAFAVGLLHGVFRHASRPLQIPDPGAPVPGLARSGDE